MRRIPRSPIYLLLPLLALALWFQFRSSEPEDVQVSDIRKTEAEGVSSESNDLNVSAKPDPGLQNEKPHPGTQPKSDEPVADVEEDADQWFSPPMRELVEGVEEGRPVRVQMGGQERQYLFRPVRITADEFRISAGPEEEMPSSFRVYEGRRMLANGRLTESAKLAVVNDTASMALTTEEGNVLIERNEAGEMVARLLRSADPDLGIGQTECLEADGIAGMRSTSDRPPLELAAGIHLAGEAEAGAEAAWPDHNFYRNGPQYDASLKDILILMVSGSTQTGPSSNLSSRAASYLTYAAKTADTYENQLGLRYLLQELVLIAEGSGEPDIEVAGTNSTLTGSDDLSALETWANTHRSKLTYGWGHIAGWTLVDGSGSGTIGYASIDGYGRLGSARSVQERNWDWDVHAHELGHNVGASHTSGGVMNPKIQNDNQDFFRENGSIGGYTGAMDIYNYMADDNRTDIYGEERLRHAEELPFAVDDFVSTDLNTPVTFNPISNDLDSVMLGRTNTHLRLVEAGAVYPANAGTVSQNGNELTFTPATGFSGNVWFRYTLGGNIGNNSKGWLHAADVVVTVGGNNSDPGLSPSMTLVDDVLVSDLSGPVRVNPLLNDVAEGRLWSGDVEALNDVDGTPQAYSDDAFHLVSATVVTGNGSVSLDTRNMTRSASPGTDYTGYLTYTPSGSEPGTIEISYTAEDANGTQASASVFIQNRTAVTLSASSSLFSEVEGRVVELTFSRSGAADLSASETVSFSVGGAVSAAGANADIALGGHASFDVDSRSGTIVIPAGQSQAVLKLSAYDDGVVEGQEKMLIQMTGAESLSIPDEASLLLTLWDDAVGGKPLVESFDQFAEPNGIGQENAWNNPSSGDDPNQDWEVQSGGTPSNETGPSADHTSGSGNYVYYETSSGFNGSTAYLESPVFSLAGESTADLEFYYHMYGASMGSLAVDVRTDGGSWNLDALSWTGQQSVDATDWKQATLDLSGYLPTGTMQLRFRATRGNNFTGDIAVDDVKVTFPFSLSTESPVIEAQPQSQVVGEGDPVYFSVVARSYPSASYQWFKDGSPISGATRSVLSFSSTSASDAGTYTCEVTSGSTVTTQNAVLGIDTIPTVVIDSPSPSPVEIASGSMLTLEATATDDGALTTTWTMVNGPTAAVFDDASAEDTTVTFPQTGAYRLRLTADDGSRQGEAEILVMVGSGAVEDRFPSGGEVGTYPLDASSGTAATDSSGNDYHGTLVGGPVWQSSGGKIGGALQFDGGDDLVELVSLAGFNTAYSDSSRSVALWFHADDVSVSTRKQILWEAGGGSHGYSIYLFNSQLYVATWSDSGAANDAYLISSGISNSTWHHVALTLSGSSLVGYLDGAEIDTASVAALPEHSNDNGIGNAFGATRFHDGSGSSGPDHGFDGRIDHVGLYTRVLTPTEVAELAGAVQNRAPVVDAGADDDPSSPASGVAFALSGSAVDPDTDPVTFTWTKESGPGSVGFADASDATTAATFASSGTYVLRLSASDGSVTVSDTVQFTVTDSSSPGLLQLTSASYAPGEGDGNLSVQVERVNGISGGVGVTLSTVNGTALAGEDFTAVSQAVTWADGELGTKTVLIPLLDDSDVESSEQFQVELSLPTGGASLGTPDTGTVTITDNDLPGTLQLTASTANVDEGVGTVTLTVSRTGGDAGVVSVDYATSNGTATAGSDYTAATDTLNWADGDSEAKDIVLSITDDGDEESTETFTLTLSNAVSATLGVTDSATVSITDDEFSPASVPGLVGWYDAQALSGTDGTAVTTWADSIGGTNSVAHDLTQVTSVTGTSVAPTLQTVNLNGYDYRSVRTNILSGDQYELLENSSLVSSGDTSRTVVVVYKGGVDHPNSRPVGFGSTMENGSLSGDKVTWNLGCDGTGSSRFDGAKIASDTTGGTYGAGLDRSTFLIRTAVMENSDRFDEFIDVLDVNFTDSQVLSNGVPNLTLSTIRGDFFIGDVQGTNKGGGDGDSDFDILEVLVFDTVLSNTDRQNVQNWLKTKYTTDPNPSATIEVVRDSDSAVMSAHASVSDAIANLPGGTGYTIVMPAGTFTESGALLLPEGIGLRGAGVDATTLVSTFSSSVNGAFPPDKFAIQLDSASQTAGDQILEDFTLDGSSWTVQGGIYLDNRTGVTLRDLRVRNFSWSGIWVERVQNVNLTNVEVLESSWSDNNYASGSIGIGDADTVTLDQVTITSTNSGGGDTGVGYGIKATHSNSTGRFWETVVIQNSTIDVMPNGVWNGGQAPNISIEAHNLEIRNSRITNNTLYNNMSIVGTASGATPSMRIDNNQVVLKDASASNGNYGVEMSTPNMEVDHNYFGGAMVRALAHWAASTPLTGTKIHHNIFQGNQGDTLIWLKSEAPGLLFANNVYAKTTSGGSAMRIFYLNAGDTSGMTIANNIFYVTSGSPDENLIVFNTGATASGLVVRNNWLQRIVSGSPSGTWANNQTGSPLGDAPIVGTGDFWDTYYQSPPGSVLVNAGVDVGLAFEGAAPEIGRWELATSVAPSGLSASTVSASQIDLSWTDNSNDETGFKVERSTTGGGVGFSLIHTTAADATGYSDTGLTSNTTYYYRVTATNASGDSSATAETSDTTTALPGTIALSASTYSVDEDGATVTITASRSGGSDGVVGISYASANATATAGTDYTAVSSTLSWTDGDSANKTFAVTIADDSDVESSETFTVTLSAVTGGATLGSPSAATVTINDNDALPTAASGLTATTASASQINLSWTDNSNNETGFKVERSTTGGGSGFSLVTTTAADATSYSDTGLSSNTTYYYRVTATNASGDSSATTEASDTTTAAPGTLQLTASSWNPGEGDGTVTITVERVSGTDGDVSIQYATSNGTATAGSDYTAASGTLNWSDGDTADKTFDITLTDDGDIESSETITVTLSNPGGSATLGSPSSGTVTIADNEVPPTLIFHETFEPATLVANSTAGTTYSGDEAWKVADNSDSANDTLWAVNTGLGWTGNDTSSNQYLFADSTGSTVSTDSTVFRAQGWNTGSAEVIKLRFRFAIEPGNENGTWGALVLSNSSIADTATPGSGEQELHIRLHTDGNINTVGDTQIGGSSFVTGPAAVNTLEVIYNGSASSWNGISSKQASVTLNGTLLDGNISLPNGVTDTGAIDLIEFRAFGALNDAGANPAQAWFDEVVVVEEGVPSILTQPETQTVDAGNPVTFSVVAEALPTALTYQWKKDGVNIGGATGSSYTIGTTVVGDAADYTVEVTNSAGTTASSAATLTINGGAAPVAASGLTATTASASQIDLSWTDNSNNETGFKVERSTTGGGAGFTLVTTTAADATSYSDTGLNSNTTYYYRVTATNASGDSSATAEASDTTTAAPGTIALSASTYSVDEDGGTVTVTASRSGGSDGVVGISFASADDTATAGTDYTTVSSTLSWSDGDSADKTFSVTITDDGDIEGAESFDVSLTSPTGGATLGSPSTATVTINDNDGTTYSANVVIYGATSGGIMSAIQAVKEGKTVELVEPTTHIGGTTTGGLGWVDGGILSTIGGMSLDFFNTVAVSSPSTPTGFSGGSNPWTLIPSEAMAEFQSLLTTHSITVRTGNRLVRGGGGVVKTGATITKIIMENGNEFVGDVFIDATYEGDLMAEAGVSYIVGRESSAQYGESQAGVVGPNEWQPQQFDYFIDPYVTPGDAGSGLLPYIQAGPLAATGSADTKTQAYNFRICLTRSQTPADRVEITEPTGYDPAKFEILRRYIAVHPNPVLKDDLLKISPLKDLKTDINNRGPFSTDHIGQNWDYPDGDYATREAIWQEHVDFTKGLLWFLKSDPDIPASIRNDMAAFAYPADEYVSNENWSPQLYVREARRMIGPYVMTESDIVTNDTKTDAIGQASYGVDSHHVQRLIFPGDYPASPDSSSDMVPYGRNSAGQLQNEGNFLAEQHAYDVPYTAITPVKAECDNLLVTFCVSASHIAFGSMRMEPVFMHLGQSAGTAASQAIDQGVAVQDVDYQTLRTKLLADGQVMSDAGAPSVVISEYFNDYGISTVDIGGLNGGTGWGGAWDASDAEYVPGSQLTYAGTGYDNSENQNDANDGRVRWKPNTGGGSIIPRPLGKGLDGTIWVSVLVQMTGLDRAYLWLDSDAAVNGGNSGTFFGIDDDSAGELIVRFNDNVPDINVDSTVATGTPHLLLAKVEVDYSGTNDRVSFWFNPDLSGGEAGLGTPDIVSSDTYTGDAFGTSVDGIAIQLTDRTDPDSVGSILDAIRISNLATGFYDVTADAPLVPSAPSGLSVSTVSSSQIDLSWTDNSADETGFKIQRSTTTGTGFSTIHTTAADAISYSDTGRTAGTEYFYQVIATNASGDSTPTTEASATTWTASESWRDQYFSQTGNSGDAANNNDFDNDGVPNLLERAFGTNPTLTGSVALPSGGVADDGGSDYLMITYRRLTGGAGTTGVDYTVDGMTYTVEYDDDLTPPWSSGAVTQVGTASGNGDGTETVTVRLNAGVSSQTIQFIKVGVTDGP